ncbi:MAG: hypothetical protein ACOC4F_02865 [bacterium]
MNVHLIPLTPSRSYNRDVAAYCRENSAVTAVHLSHLLCHHADELIGDRARAELNRDIASIYRDQGCDVWAWTHEVHHPPAYLLGAFPEREQWVEHDLGHEYEGQHVYPYADLPQLASRIATSAAAGSSTVCLRLDRYHGDTGQSAIYTPWGRRELETAFATARGASSNESDLLDCAEEAELLACATRVVNHMLFPARMWLADHSNLPDYRYAIAHLVDGNADRLPDWTNDVDDIAVAEAFRTMNDTVCDPPLSTRLAQEMLEAPEALKRCRELIARHEQTLGRAGVRAGT